MIRSYCVSGTGFKFNIRPNHTYSRQSMTHVPFCGEPTQTIIISMNWRGKYLRWRETVAMNCLLVVVIPWLPINGKTRWRACAWLIESGQQNWIQSHVKHIHHLLDPLLKRISYVCSHTREIDDWTLNLQLPYSSAQETIIHRIKTTIWLIGNSHVFGIVQSHTHTKLIIGNWSMCEQSAVPTVRCTLWMDEPRVIIHGTAQNRELLAWMCIVVHTPLHSTHSIYIVCSIW